MTEIFQVLGIFSMFISALVGFFFWLIQRKAKSRFITPGTEGHPGYGFNAWMKDYALPEHLLQWPLILCPILAAAQAGLGLLLQKIG